MDRYGSLADVFGSFADVWIYRSVFRMYWALLQVCAR